MPGKTKTDGVKADASKRGEPLSLVGGGEEEAAALARRPRLLKK